MSYFHAFAVITFLVLSAPAFAADPTGKQIDQKYAACLEQPDMQSISGSVECAGKAAVAYDKLLNQTYKAALANIDLESQKLLRAAQRKWIAFREAEEQSQSGPWRMEGGSVLRIISVQNKIAALKARIAELSIYLPITAN